MSHNLPSAPKPLPAKKPVHPSEPEERWLQIKEKNWKSEYHPRWWQWQPKHDHRCSVAQMRDMDQLLLDEEKELSQKEAAFTEAGEIAAVDVVLPPS